jgi:NDP-sugar pyrophosphorylase family protein
MIKTAVMLAGGKGTRLRPLTYTTPKPLLPVGNLPIMDHILSLLHLHGFKKVVIAVNYLAEKIINHLVAKWVDTDLEIVAPLIHPADTADAVRKLSNYIDEDFIVTMGDVITNINLRSFADHHEKSGTLASIALIEVPSLRDFGAVLVDQNGYIYHFLEKPDLQEMYVTSIAFAMLSTRRVNLFANLANSGFYAFKHEILEILEENPHLMDFGKHVFPWLLENGYRISGWYASDVYWVDVGRPATFLRANFDLLDGYAEPLKPYGKAVDGNFFGENVELRHGATIIPPVALGDNVEIDGGAVIGPYAVVGSDTFIGKKTKIRNSVIIGKTTILENVLVENSILAKNILVENDTVIKENSVIGDGVVIRRGSVLGPGATVYISQR